MVNSSRKGKVGERFAANLMEELTGVPWRRTQQHRSAGVVGDVECAVDHPVWSRFHVEVKNNESLQIGNRLFCMAIEQAYRDCPVGHTPILIHKERRNVWLISFKIACCLSRDPYVVTASTPQAQQKAMAMLYHNIQRVGE